MFRIVMRSVDRDQESILMAYEIEHVLKRIISQVDSMTQKAEEPDYIAWLSLCFPHALAQILNLSASFQNCSVTGVFCHQKPTAIIDINAPEINISMASWGTIPQSWGNPQSWFKNPEIGDLLLVYVEYSYGSNLPKINSLLLQAKKTKLIKKKVPKSEGHQLFLYTKWPKFVYNKAGNLNRQSRDIRPKAIHSGAEYLLIGKNHLKCAIPDFSLYGDKALSDEIVDLLRFRAGRTVDTDNNSFSNSSDDWSKLIWDLLSICKKVKANRRNIGLNDFPRYVEEIVQGGSMQNLTEDAAWTSSSNQPPSIFNGIDYAEGNNEISGVSAIIIENHI